VFIDFANEGKSDSRKARRTIPLAENIGRQKDHPPESVSLSLGPETPDISPEHQGQFPMQQNKKLKG
jgi:hypothetical protein